jgi:hypothetical protein
MAISQTIERFISNLSSVGNEQQARQRAVKNAYAKFVPKYPAWAESLFDMYFLTHVAAPILEEYARSGTSEAIRALAGAWVDQLAWYSKAREQRINEVMPIAAAFLCLLEAELMQSPSRAAGKQLRSGFSQSCAEDMA